MDTGSISTATASPVEADIKGQKVELYPLRFMDWGKIEQWMRSRIVDAAKDVIVGDDSLTLKQREDVMRSAHKEAAHISLASCFFANPEQIKQMVGLEGKAKEAAMLKLISSTEQAVTYLQTFEGMLRVVHLGIRESRQSSKPKFDVYQLDEMLQQDFGLLTQLFGTVFELSFPDMDVQLKTPSNPQQAAEQPQN